MIYAVISDIHGNARQLRKAFSIADANGCDAILLLGDLLYHGPRNPITEGYDAKETAALLNARKNSVIAVRGNCDAEVDQMMLDFPIDAPYNQLLSPTGKIFMMHGHLHDLNRLPFGRGDIILSGHTHKPVLETLSNEAVHFNPGSISLPKGVFSFGTMGLIKTDGECELINIETCEHLPIPMKQA